jgi:hypothetical protein
VLAYEPGLTSSKLESQGFSLFKIAIQPFSYGTQALLAFSKWLFIVSSIFGYFL